MNKKKVDWRVLSVGLICLTVLECFAMSQGINGWLLRIIIIIIAAVLGFTVPSPIELKTNERRK